MNIKDEMIPVCGDFALESFASYLGEVNVSALEGAITEAKDSVTSKLKNMTNAVMEKIKKTAKGKNAEALKKDKEHILKEQANVAKAAMAGRELISALHANEISQNDFVEKFKSATEGIRISKSLVGIGDPNELTLQDMQEYSRFLTEASTVIDDALEALGTPEFQEIPAMAMEIDDTAIEGVWNCAYDAYARNCEAGMEGMNMVRKPLTKKEFQAVFNQERVREDENLRNAIAHGKYSRTELVDMGLLKEDTKDLGKGEYEQLLVDYEKELNEMKGKDDKAKAEYIKKNKLPYHLIHCLNGEDVNSYEDFIKSAKKKDEKETGEAAEESAKVGNFTIVTKMEEVEKSDKKTPQVKNNEAEAEKVENAIKTQNKQEKMPESDIEKKAPDKMNKAQESVEDPDILEIVSSIVELGDEEDISAIESLVEELEAADSTAIEGKIDNIKSRLNNVLSSVKNKVSKSEAESNVKETEALLKELKEKYEICKKYEEDITENTAIRSRHYGPALNFPKEFLEAHSRCSEILNELDSDEVDKTIQKYCEMWTDKIHDSNMTLAGEGAEVPQESDNQESSEERKSTDKEDIDEAAKKFVEKANIVKEHLVDLKPRFARDRKGCAGEVGKILKEVEDLIPYASEITDSDEKIKAYDHIAQQRAALQKALDNIPPDVDETQDIESSAETTEAKAPAVEARDEDGADSNEKETSTKEEKAENNESTNPEVRKVMDNYHKFLINMKDEANYHDGNLAITAIQCRSQAIDLLSKANRSDTARLENAIKTCETFIGRFTQEIKKA